MCWPSNQFGSQERGSPEQIREFVTSKFSVPGGNDSFVMMEKVDVNGPNTHSVYSYLKQASGDASHVDWNFRGKFIISKDGAKVVRSAENPLALEPLVQELLAA